MLKLLMYFMLAAHAATSSDENPIAPDCGEMGDCVAENIECNNIVGSFYNDTMHECVINMKLLLKNLTSKYDVQDKVRLEVQKVFQGVIISVILFVSCASVCVFAACIYCCRINYEDYRLKNDVEALAAKLKRDCNLKKPRMKTPKEPASESCNIVVEGAGVYVV
ncbi:unnamed protein product, partial [Iphiclides podalirius]